MTEAYRQQAQEAQEAADLLAAQNAAIRACQEVAAKNASAFTFVDMRQNPDADRDFERMTEDKQKSDMAIADLRESLDRAHQTIGEALLHMTHGDNDAAFTLLQEYAKSI